MKPLKRLVRILTLSLLLMGFAESPSPLSALCAQTWSYTFQKGDTLGRVSQKLYGTSKKWKAIAKWNQLKPPYSIQVGQVLTLLEKPAPKKQKSNQLKTWSYETQDNEILGEISEKLYGDSSLWIDIAHWNHIQEPYLVPAHTPLVLYKEPKTPPEEVEKQGQAQAAKKHRSPHISYHPKTDTYSYKDKNPERFEDSNAEDFLEYSGETDRPWSPIRAHSFGSELTYSDESRRSLSRYEGESQEQVQFLQRLTIPPKSGGHRQTDYKVLHSVQGALGLLRGG